KPSCKFVKYVMHATGDSKRDEITRTDRSNGDQMRAEMIRRPRNWSRLRPSRQYCALISFDERFPTNRKPIAVMRADSSTGSKNRRNGSRALAMYHAIRFRDDDNIYWKMSD